MENNEIIVDATPVATEQVVENNEQPTPEKPVITPFKKGDLYVKCSCGEVEFLEKGVENGIRIEIPCTDYHRMTLACKACKANITIGFVESTVVDEVKSDVEPGTILSTNNEDIANEQVQENSI